MIRTETDGKSWPPGKLKKRWYQYWDRLRRTLTRDVLVVDESATYRFRCETLRELSRSMRLFTEEAGTVNWIKTELMPGQVFYDIGANIGIYTILAAHVTGADGKVVAFEPHSANFSRLLENIAINKLENIVVPCSTALFDQEGFFPFYFSRNEPAAANNQLETKVSAHETEHRSAGAELKYATTVDSLIASGKIDPPHHVKIDVDGNEVAIIKGMSGLLDSDARPRSIQIEVNKRDKDLLDPVMESHGYVLSEKNYTECGLKLIAEGGDPEAYTYNAIYRPKG